MIWMLLGLLVVAAVAAHGVYCYLKYRAAFAALANSHYSLRESYSSLRDKYNRVQHGYNQGVAEGMGKAYANLRTDWIDRLEKSTPQERAFLLGWRWSPANDYDAARMLMNKELQQITGPDNDVNYADALASDDGIVKQMIKIGG